ncbi:hypothetical protein C8Q77DRAFT_349320 [Trametes polyzona]|nr:hypothetical protein C8Q77DRAFT_349320 [Trametes polyzona]
MRSRWLCDIAALRSPTAACSSTLFDYRGLIAKPISPCCVCNRDTEGVPRGGCSPPGASRSTAPLCYTPYGRNYRWDYHERVPAAMTMSTLYPRLHGPFISLPVDA